MGYENLIYEKKDHVVTLTLNRPDFLNALDGGLLSELGAAADEINADADVRVAVVTGAGRGSADDAAAARTAACDARGMSTPGILEKVDAVTVHVPDLDAGPSFYVGVLGDRLAWRNERAGQAGLRLAEGDSELVSTTEHGDEPNRRSTTSTTPSRCSVRTAVRSSSRHARSPSVVSPSCAIRSGTPWSSST